MVTLEQTFRPHLDEVDTALNGEEMVLLHLGSNTYYSLNMTGTRIWQGVLFFLQMHMIGGECYV